MIKKLALSLVVVGLTTSCVSKKIYNDLENKFADLKKERNNLFDEESKEIIAIKMKSVTITPIIQGMITASTSDEIIESYFQK